MTKTQRKNLDKQIREACFARDGYRYVRCGRTDTLAPSHIYPKGKYPSMRYVLDNVKTLCYGCHIHFWHKSPIEAWEWIKTALPAARLKRLKKLSQTNTGLKKVYVYEQIKSELEAAKEMFI